MKTLLIIVLALAMLACAKTTEETETIPNNPMLIALDSIAEGLQGEGWTKDAAYLIAGVEVGLYDPQIDTAEYRLYQAYMED